MARPFDFMRFDTEPREGEDAPPRINFQTIARLVTEELELEPLTLFDVSRQARLVFARHGAWWLARKWTGLSFPQIGRLSRNWRTPGRDHTSVLHGVQRIDGWRAGAGSYAGVPSYAEWMARRG